MPDAIAMSYQIGNASYDRIAEAGAENQQQPPEAPPVQQEGDRVEITITETTPEGNAASASSPIIYSPSTLSDRFKFDIANGTFENERRFNPLTVRFNTSAVSTYEARQSFKSQIAQTGGQSGSSSALFELNYQDAAPNQRNATTNVDAKNEQNRMVDQNLYLLNSL